MRKGKIAAQCAHASMKVLLDRMTPPEVTEFVTPSYVSRRLIVAVDSALWSWLDGLFAKICVYVTSEEELDALALKADEVNIMNVTIVDSGRTEFHGVPTKTVLAIGPAWNEDIDKITGHLPLL